MDQSAAKAKGPCNTMVTDAEARNRHQQQTERLRAKLSSLLRPLLFAGLAALLLRGLVYEPYTIPTASMQPTLQRGDTVFVAKWPYGISRHMLPLAPSFLSGRLFPRLPAHGEIIVFKSPRDNRTDLIKRVIGLPGDRVAIRSGQLLRNGEIAEPAAAPGPDLPPTRVPEGHLFVLGDHRSASADSRWSLAEGGVGMVPLGHVVGRADIILFSASPSGPRLGKRL
jgi:signal peptidase I